MRKTTFDSSRERYGFIDTTGAFVISPQFENAASFSDGLAAVKIDGMWGFIDRSGRQVIPPTFATVSRFSESLSAVKERWFYEDPGR
jgi:hypothetical protein